MATQAQAMAGTPLLVSRRSPGRAVQSSPARAALGDRQAQKTVQRGLQSQVRKAGKLLPKKGEGYVKDKPKQTKRLSSARNEPRAGGFGGGKPFQKPRAGAPLSVDPIVYVGGLLAVFIVIIFSLTSTSTA